MEISWRTPLDLVIDNNRKEIVEMLIPLLCFYRQVVSCNVATLHFKLECSRSNSEVGEAT